VNSRKRKADNKKSSDFVCLCCGTCCSRYQPRISLEEVDSIARNLNINADQFIQQYTDHRWPGTQSFLIQHVNSACVFLKSSENGDLKICSIHTFKPACCLDWQARADRAECQEGMNKKHD
jgi:hypothetical protein